ncbi:MAG: PD40 domain-containing protein [Calditrichaeota bacterium]|nr:PD40 domain-containing protein [Calditrichota bacterium]
MAKMTLSALIALLLLLNAGLVAQDEIVPNHPELVWKTIETEHFLVHYHQGTQRTANNVARIAEDIFPHVTGLYDYEPDSKVEFVIKDTEDYANGGAYFFDNKIDIWAENLDYVLRGTHNWLLDVITHEYTHIISLQKALKTSRRMPAAWFQLFGYEQERRPDVVRGFPDVLVSYPISNIVVPVWWAEGVCQFQNPTRRFDYRDSHREMILRDRVVTGEVLTLDEMGTFGKNSIGNESSYNQGFDFVRYLADSFGDTVVTRMAQAASGPLRLNFKGAIREATGKDAEALYRSWIDSKDREYRENLGSILDNPVIGDGFVEEGIGNMFPAVSPDGQKVAYLATGESPSLSRNDLEIQDLASGKITKVSGEVTRNVAWSPDGRYLAYSKLTPVIPSFSLYNDLYVYDSQTRETHRLTRAMRARHPAWSHNGKQLAFIVETDGLTHLTTIGLGENPDAFFAAKPDWQDLYFNFETSQIQDEALDEEAARKMAYRGTSVKQLTHYTDGRQIFHPQWSPADDYLVFDTSLDFGRDIARIPANGGEVSFLLEAEYDERYPVFHPSTGELWYACDETGIFNIYSLNLETGEKKAYTNVVGGAFMPSPSVSGDLFYSLYKDQGYKIFRIREAKALARSDLAYIENYASRVPDLGQIDQSLKNPLPPQNYRRGYSKLTFMPRVLVDYGTVKPGLYVYTNEMLNKISFFAGGDINKDREHDLFGILELKTFGGPNVFFEAYNQTAKIKDSYDLAGINASPEVDVSFNLLQTNAGLAGLLPAWKFGTLMYRLEYIYSWYRAKLSSTGFTDPASGQFVAFAPLRYSYLRGHAGSLYLRSQKREPSYYGTINPRHGRYASLRYTYEYNNYLKDFATDRQVGIEVYDPVKFNKLELNYEQYLPVPGTRYHALNLRLQGGFIDTEVDSFFHFFAGGLVGLKGYPFYSIEGTRMAVGTATYRFPLIRDINKQIGNVFLGSVFLGGFYQYGYAWRGNELPTDDFLSTAGVQLRLNTYSWYFFPTQIFAEAAYPLKEQINQGVTYPQEWKFYLGVLFDFDLRLEKRGLRLLR